MSKGIILKNAEGENLFPQAYRDNKGNIISEHIENTKIHLEEGEKDAGNEHVANTDIHVKKSDKTKGNNHINDDDIHLSEEQKDLLDNFYSLIYPVGSVYYTVDEDFDPNDNFEDTTWESFGNTTVTNSGISFYRGIRTE